MSEEMIRTRYLEHFMDIFPNMECDNPKLNKIVDARCDILLISNKYELDEIDLSTLRFAYNDYFKFLYSAMDSKNIDMEKFEKEYKRTKKNYGKFERNYPEICSDLSMNLSFAIIEGNIMDIKQQKGADTDKSPKRFLC